MSVENLLWGAPRRSEGQLPTRIIGSAADNSCRIGKPELAMEPRLDPPSRLAPATEEDAMAKKAKAKKAKKAKKARKSK